jgi:hypothetical protein
VRKLRQENGHSQEILTKAIALLINLVTADKFAEFLTLPAYRQLTRNS